MQRLTAGSAPSQRPRGGADPAQATATDLGECREWGLPAPSAHERRVGVFCYRPQGTQTLLIKAGVILVKVFSPAGCVTKMRPDLHVARAGSPAPSKQPYPAALTALLRAWSWSHWSHNRPPASGKRASSATKRVLGAGGRRGHGQAGPQGACTCTRARGDMQQVVACGRRGGCVSAQHPHVLGQLLCSGKR